jgi:hypothetical protein
MALVLFGEKDKENKIKENKKKFIWLFKCPRFMEKRCL